MTFSVLTTWKNFALVPHFTAESKQDWEALMRNFMKEFCSPTKIQSLRNKIDTFVQFPMETIAEALERFNEYMQVELLEWHIGFLMRRMENMEVEKGAQDLKAAEARSTCEECAEYDHVQGKPRFNASSPIHDLVPLCTQLKDFMDEQAKINKDTVTKFEGYGENIGEFRWQGDGDRKLYT
jgi:hypothetical protein